MNNSDDVNPSTAGQNVSTDLLIRLPQELIVEAFHDIIIVMHSLLRFLTIATI